MNFNDVMVGLGFMIGGVLLSIARNKVIRRRKVRRSYKQVK